jgi:hypothetical protein
MAEKEQKSAGKTSTRLDVSSRFRKRILVVLAALFVFSGPYVVLMLSNALDLDYALSMASGIAVFVVGLILLWYVLRKNLVIR